MHYKTKDSEATYLAAYEAAMKSWPVPWEALKVPNRFGTTYVIASGPEKAPPLVLLHGFFTTLLLWTPNIADLSKSYRIYAVDIMGNRNRSIPAEPIRTKADMVAWLGEALNGLELQSVYLAGLSFGGWLGINFALARRDRVRKLILIAPAASILPLVKQFLPRAIMPLFPPRKFWFHSLMGWIGLRRGPGHEFSNRLLDLMWLGTEHIRLSPETMRVKPAVFSDKELSALKMPVLLLIGEKEVIYNAEKAMDRARRLIPDLTGELVPACGHDISFRQHEIVDERIIAFLD